MPMTSPLLFAECLCSDSGLPGRHTWPLHCERDGGGVSVQQDRVLIQGPLYQERPERHGLPASGPSRMVHRSQN